MNWRAVSESWNSRPASKKALVSPSKREKWVCMPRARVVGEGLGHERGVDALLDRDLLDHGAEGHDVVGRLQRVGVAQVDLVLARAVLVVAEFHGDAHGLEHGHRGAAEVLGDAAGDVVEVAAAVHRHRVAVGSELGGA